MALPLAIEVKCKKVGAADSTQSSPSYNGGVEAVLFETTGSGGDGGQAHGGPIILMIDVLAKQGLFTEGTTYTLTLST